MPEPRRLSEIRRRARRLRGVTRAQETAVAEASREGYSLREIAAAAGLTPEGVRKMIQRSAR